MSHETQFPVVPTFPLGYDVVRPGTTGETIFPLGQTGLVTYTTIPQPAHYWTLDEGDAATRVDTAGALHLSGAAPAGTGVHNGAAEIQRALATTRELTAAGPILPTDCTAFALSMWAKYNAVTTAARLFTFGLQQAYLYNNVVPRCRVYSDPATAVEVLAPGMVSAGAWLHFFAALHGGMLHLWVNGARGTSVSFAGAVYYGGVDHTVGMRADPSDVAATSYLADETAVWTHLNAIDSDEQLATMAADLYNSGAGRFWTPTGGWQAP